MFIIIALFVSAILLSILVGATSFYTYFNAGKIYYPVKSVASGIVLGLITGISIGLA
tara:strand:- start:7405 stop:7575 length:171 start_codon:yes stop_codon:yes gene_type:complete